MQDSHYLLLKSIILSQQYILEVFQNNSRLFMVWLQGRTQLAHSLHQQGQELVVHQEQCDLPCYVLKLAIFYYRMSAHHQAQNVKEQQNYCLVHSFLKSLVCFCQHHSSFLQETSFKQQFPQKGAIFWKPKKVVNDDKYFFGVFINVIHEYVTKLLSLRYSQLFELTEFLQNSPQLRILLILKQLLIDQPSKDEQPIVVSLIEAIFDQKGNMLPEVIFINMGIDTVKLQFIQLFRGLRHHLSMLSEYSIQICFSVLSLEFVSVLSYAILIFFH